MIIEVILIVLGVLTGSLGIWNMIVGAYVWGALFLIGGIWSVWLGILYIIQDRKAKAQEQAKSVISTHTPEDATQMAVDDGILTQDLFAAGYEAGQASQSDTAVLDDIVEQVGQTQVLTPNNTMGLPPGANPYAPNPNGYYGYPQNGAMAPGGQSQYPVNPMGQPGPYINQVPGFVGQGQTGTGAIPAYGQSMPTGTPDWESESVQETTVVLENEASASESETVVADQTTVAEITTDQTVIFEAQTPSEESTDNEAVIVVSADEPQGETQLESAEAQTSVDVVVEPVQETENTTPEMETVEVTEQESKAEERTETAQASTPKTHVRAPIFSTEAQRRASQDQTTSEKLTENETSPVSEPAESVEQNEPATETGFILASADEQTQDNDYTPMSNNGDVIFLGGEIQSPDESQTE